MSGDQAQPGTQKPDKGQHVCKVGITDIQILEPGKDSEEPGKLDLKAQFIQLRATGLSFRKIAKKLQVSKSTLANWNEDLAEEIAIHRAIEMEALQEEYWLHKEGRIRLLGGIVQRLQKEAKARSLEDISTETLFLLLFKFQEKLQAEAVDLRPLSTREAMILKSLRKEG